MYKVFVNNRPLTFGNSKVKHKKNIAFNSPSDFDVAVDLLSKNEDAVHLYAEDEKALWKTFKRHFKKIKAAGGVVKNKQNELLWIYRLGMWDLPKGKMEKGEDKETTAIREVEEECGISKLSISKRLPNTYHMYFQKQHILKITYWYEMHYDGNEPLIPQTEEGITNVQWFAKSEWRKPLNNTYANIQELMHSYLD